LAEADSGLKSKSLKAEGKNLRQAAHPPSRGMRKASTVQNAEGTTNLEPLAIAAESRAEDSKEKSQIHERMAGLVMRHAAVGGFEIG